MEPPSDVFHTSCKTQETSEAQHFLTSHCCQHVTARQLHLLRDTTGAFHLGSTLGLAAAPGDRSLVPACATCPAILHNVVAVSPERLDCKPAAVSDEGGQGRRTKRVRDLEISCASLLISQHNHETCLCFYGHLRTMFIGNMCGAYWSSPRQETRR